MDKIINYLESQKENTKEKIEGLSFEKLQTMTNSEFLKIEHDNRLQYITKNQIKSENIKNKINNSIEFNFTFRSILNRNLYLKTTAGQVLPDEVRKVVCKGITYSRDGISGEFFSETNSRLIIKQGTKIDIKEIGDISILKVQKNVLLDIYKEIHPENIIFIDIVEEAINRGINIDFAIMFFGEKLKGLNILSIDRKILLEDIFTEFDRIRPSISMWNGKQLEGGKYPDEFVLKLIQKLGLDYGLAEDYGIDINVIDIFKQKKPSADYLSPIEKNRIILSAPEYIKNLVKLYFPAEEYENAILVCNGESRFDKNAINYNTDKHLSVDRGLFQINDYWHGNKYIGKNIYDPETNIKIAAQIFRESNNSWRLWYAARKIGLA